MSFMTIKAIHMLCALCSYMLFFLRGIWTLNGSPIMRQRWVKVVPHIIDTLLLSSALWLALTIEQYPLVDAWLTAKFFALLLYIGLGSVALKYGRSRTTRIYAWLAAQLVFVYIVLVAVQHNPLPFTH